MKRGLRCSRLFMVYKNILKLVNNKKRDLYNNKSFNVFMHDSEKTWDYINNSIERNQDSRTSFVSDKGSLVDDRKLLNYFNN